MEPDVRAFLVLVMQSVSVVLLWMLINMTLGIYFDLGFFEGQLTVWNILYYIFFIGTLAMLIIYLRKRWKGFKELDE
jgi:hypothetical protein